MASFKQSCVRVYDLTLTQVKQMSSGCQDVWDHPALQLWQLLAMHLLSNDPTKIVVVAIAPGSLEATQCCSEQLFADTHPLGVRQQVSFFFEPSHCSRAPKVMYGSIGSSQLWLCQNKFFIAPGLAAISTWWLSNKTISNNFWLVHTKISWHHCICKCHPARQYTNMTSWGAQSPNLASTDPSQERNISRHRHIQTQPHTTIYTYTYIYMHTYSHTYTFTHIPIHKPTYTCTYTSIPWSTSIHIDIHTYRYRFTYRLSHAHSYTDPATDRKT